MKPARAEKKITSFIRRYFESAGKSTAIVGLSGGLDSAATAALCVKALGKKNVLSVLLPSASTPADDLGDASDFASKLGVRAMEFEIEPVISSFRGLAAGRLQRANVSARARMIILYSLAQKEGGLVVGTGDKSEFMLGYFTKYGDGGADLFPIGGLYKTEVRQLALALGVPARIANKPPSPALWLGQTAESELGFSYEEADKVLSAIEKGAAKKQLGRRFGKELAASVLSRIEKNRHKSAPAPVCRV